MIRYFLAGLFFFLFAVPSHAQSGSAPKVERIFLDPSDSTRNYYTILYPTKRPWKGYVFVLPGFGEQAARVMQQTDLPKKLAMNGLLTIIPTFQDGVLSFGVDSASQHSLKQVLSDIRQRHAVHDLPFYIGGYSIGGSCAIKYAELAELKPKAVFAIDPPLDFERMYHAAKRDIRLAKDAEPNEENVYIVERLGKEVGGSPATHQQAYYAFSPYSFSDTTQRAVKKLIAMPVRIYTEPDIHWWMKERGADFTSMNATECSAFINELNRLGNKQAQLITTTNKGFRKPDHMRHPHSWSIVDNDELIRWLLNNR
jgi:hypothetical protein